MALAKRFIASKLVLRDLGTFGREYIASFTVRPECPISGIARLTGECEFHDLGPSRLLHLFIKLFHLDLVGYRNRYHIHDRGTGRSKSDSDVTARLKLRYL